MNTKAGVHTHYFIVKASDRVSLVSVYFGPVTTSISTASNNG